MNDVVIDKAVAKVMVKKILAEIKAKENYNISKETSINNIKEMMKEEIRKNED